MPIQYRPYERKTLDALTQGVAAGLPGQTAYGIYSGVQQGALDRRAQRRATRLDMLSGLGSQLTEAALGGVPASGLEALVGLQTAANPMLGRVNPSRLDQLVSSAGTLSGSVPGETTDSPLWDQTDEDAVRNFTRMMDQRGMDPQQIRELLKAQFSDPSAATLFPLVNSAFEDEYRQLHPEWQPGFHPQGGQAPGAQPSIGLNAGNTRWQDAFGLFPNLFG